MFILLISLQFRGLAELKGNGEEVPPHVTEKFCDELIAKIAIVVGTCGITCRFLGWYFILCFHYSGFDSGSGNGPQEEYYFFCECLCIH